MKKESLFLILVAIGLIPLGITYGAHPSLNLLPISFLDEVEINSIDHANIFSGIMGLYVTMAIFWILGAFNKSLTIPALWSLVIFMTGIGVGRAISMITDGVPSNPYLLFLLLEVIFALIGFMFIKSIKSNSA
jgi:energy-converting hydrogenase Eha subunit G